MKQVNQINIDVNKKRRTVMAERKPIKVFPEIAPTPPKAPRQNMSSILGSVRVISCRAL